MMISDVQGANMPSKKRVYLKKQRAPHCRCALAIAIALSLPMCSLPAAHAQDLSVNAQADQGQASTALNANEGFESKAVPAEFFGLSFNKAGDAWPLKEPITYGLVRVWDSGAQWTNVQQQAGNNYQDPAVFNWTPLETLLQNAYQNGVNTAFYTMSRTPQFALAMSGDCTSNPNQPACDIRCNYYGTGGVHVGAGAPGQCYPPADLNPDGSGTDQTWKNWVTALANEAVALCNSGSAACIRYYEIWNEIDRNNQGYPVPGSSYAAPYLFGSTSPSNSGNAYYGSYAQLVRMTQDARCIILGQNSLQMKDGVPYGIDNVNGPDNPAVSCSQVTGIEPDAVIVAPSSHSRAAEGLNVIKNLLYCSVPDTTAGAPNWCNTGDDESYDLDATNWHMKPGNLADGFNEEAEMEIEYCAVVGCDDQAGILQPSELRKPFWNGEAGYRGASAGWSSVAGGVNLTGNPDMQASFIARYALTQWSLGIGHFAWYDYDLDSVLNGSGPNGTGPQAGDPALAWSTVADWMIGRSMTVGDVTTPCSINPGTTTQWTCPLKGDRGFIGEVIWDIGAFGCNADSYQGNDCTTYTYAPSPRWHAYRDLWGHEYSIPHGGTVQVGNLPILLENQPSGEDKE
jgi:hypothetical protein